MKPIYCVMPVLAHPDYTRAAIADLLAQSVPTRILVINQGVDDDFRSELEAIAEEHENRVLVWHHHPALPSLSASWNLALETVWATAGEVALVVNNDVRLHRQTVELLATVQRKTDALFVSCVGVTPDQFDPSISTAELWTAITGEAMNNVGIVPPSNRGGPDFSCFLITRACHQRFQFDEAFIPAFCEDLDYHRRLILAGEGARIFSVNLPYLHYGSATIKTMAAPARMKIERAIETGSRAYYARKWGGPVNGEIFVLPFRQTEDRDVTTPALQRMVQEDRAHELPRVDMEYLGGQGNWQPRDEQELHGILNDGLARTSGPDDGYRGQHRHDFRNYDPARAAFVCACGEQLPNEEIAARGGPHG
jgi:GT2 family glycosyltransferase